MKLVKASLITALAFGLCLSISPLAAQDRGDRPRQERPEGPRGQAQLQRLAEQLKLTEEQQTKLRPVLEEQAKKMMALRQDRELTPEQRRERMQKIREESTPKIKGILTTEQFGQYEKLQAQMRERAGREGGRRGPQRPDQN
jgi:hypothetical protein